MLDRLLANAGDYVHTNPWLAFAAALAGGAVTASNPCVLVMIPLMMSFVAGGGERTRGVLRALAHSLVFVLGLAVTFVLLGMTAALAGRIYGDVPGLWRWVVVAVCLFMGLHLLGWLRFPARLAPRWQPRPRARGLLGALLLGLLFGLVSAPCAAPILVVLLTYVAGTDASLVYGGALLLAYALGHSLLILLAGTSMGLARRLIESRRVARGSEILRRCAGAVIILVGAWFAAHGPN